MGRVESPGLRNFRDAQYMLDRRVGPIEFGSARRQRQLSRRFKTPFLEQTHRQIHTTKDLRRRTIASENAAVDRQIATRPTPSDDDQRFIHLAR